MPTSLESMQSVFRVYPAGEEAAEALMEILSSVVIRAIRHKKNEFFSRLY